MNTIEEKTLKHNLCINCGICKAACPLNAIEMTRNKYGELNPEINKKLCTNCGLCFEFCPNTKDKLRQEALKAASVTEPQAFGLENAVYYAAWSKDKTLRQKSCSGGVVTELAKYLLKNRKIDGMIHAQRLWARRGDLHYAAKLSSSVEEIEENASSAYQPIDFSNVLKTLKQGKTYFITGTPCVIRAVKKLFAHAKYKNINILTCALVCSHNTNAQFIDFLTEINELPDEKTWQVNIRKKDDTIPDANNFKNHIYTKEKDLLDKNRFESGWTNIWRNYYFAMNVCNYCSDFWGYEADISAKDAWGEWSSDPLGKNIVVIRNKELEKDFLNSNIEVETLSFETMKNHQIATSTYKQLEAKNKNFKSLFSRCNRKNRLFKHKIISHLSKYLYKNFGYKLSYRVLKITDKICERLAKL